MSNRNKLFGISAADTQHLLAAMRDDGDKAQNVGGRTARAPIAPEWLQFESLPGYAEIRVLLAFATKLALMTLFTFVMTVWLRIPPALAAKHCSISPATTIWG